MWSFVIEIDRLMTLRNFTFEQFETSAGNTRIVILFNICGMGQLMENFYVSN